MQDTSDVRKKEILKNMNSHLNGITVENIFEARQNKIRFRVYETDRFMHSDIESLELSVRSNNCLHRAGYRNVGDIVNKISCGEDLRVIRNCGTKSIDEIMLWLFLYNYECLSPEMQKKSMTELVELNGIR